MTVVAFQGEMGANSHIAINEVYPSATPLPWRKAGTSLHNSGCTPAQW